VFVEHSIPAQAPKRIDLAKSPLLQAQRFRPVSIRAHLWLVTLLQEKEAETQRFSVSVVDIDPRVRKGTDN